MSIDKANIEVIVTDQYADCYINNQICIMARYNDVSVFMIKKFDRFFTHEEIVDISKDIQKMLHDKLTRLMAASVIISKCLES